MVDFVGRTAGHGTTCPKRVIDLLSLGFMTEQCIDV
jgi:hypothetical protein